MNRILKIPLLSFQLLLYMKFSFKNYYEEGLIAKKKLRYRQKQNLERQEFCIYRVNQKESEFPLLC